MKMRAGFWLGLQPYFSSSSFMSWVSFPEYLLTMRCWKSPGLQVCEADEEGDPVGLVQSVPNGAGEAVNVPFHGHLLRLPGKGGQGIAVSGVGVEEVAGPRLAGILEGLPQAASAGPVGGSSGWTACNCRSGPSSPEIRGVQLGPSGSNSRVRRACSMGRPCFKNSRMVSVWSPLVTMSPRPICRTGW